MRLLLTLAAVFATTASLPYARAVPITGERGQPAVDSAAQVALGKRVFEGKVAGALCTSCHGSNARGIAGTGPDLTDSEWLHGDGSPGAVAATIKAGVLAPRRSAVPMPPFGGTPLTEAQLQALVVYIRSLAR